MICVVQVGEGLTQAAPGSLLLSVPLYFFSTGLQSCCDPSLAQIGTKMHAEESEAAASAVAYEIFATGENSFGQTGFVDVARASEEPRDLDIFQSVWKGDRLGHIRPFPTYTCGT